jgi:hypothetical protein
MYYKLKKEDYNLEHLNKQLEEFKKLMSGLNNFMERNNHFKMTIDWLQNHLVYNL